MFAVEFFQSTILAAEWYFKKKGLSVPDVLGFEVEDADTGDWSFLLFFFGFSWGRHYIWASRFAIAEHTGMLLKATSESRLLSHPSLASLVVKGVPERHMEVLGLPLKLADAVGLSDIRIRLPDLPGSAEQTPKKVHWVNLGVLDPAIRS